jgi:hypothetical protein
MFDVITAVVRFIRIVTLETGSELEAILLPVVGVATDDSDTPIIFRFRDVL